MHSPHRAMEVSGLGTAEAKFAVPPSPLVFLSYLPRFAASSRGFKFKIISGTP